MRGALALAGTVIDAAARTPIRQQSTYSTEPMSRRTEHDLLGDREVPDDVYYGVHTSARWRTFRSAGYRSRATVTSWWRLPR